VPITVKNFSANINKIQKNISHFYRATPSAGFFANQQSTSNKIKTCSVHHHSIFWSLRSTFQHKTQDIFSTDGIHSGVGNSSFGWRRRLLLHARRQTISTYFQPGSLETRVRSAPPAAAVHAHLCVCARTCTCATVCRIQQKCPVPPLTKKKSHPHQIFLCKISKPLFSKSNTWRGFTFLALPVEWYSDWQWTISTLQKKTHFILSSPYSSNTASC